MADGYYGDIPGSKTARWQVPRILEFPYSLDQLITRTGKQVQNMPHLEDRPLNFEERSKMEREGLCVACHQHYNTAMWDRIREKVKIALKDNKHQGLDPTLYMKAAKEGKALAPELHEQILEMALKALAGEDAADADDAKKRSDPDKASDADASASGSPEGNQRSSSVGQ